MKRAMKKILFFLTAVMLVVAVVQTASAAETIDSGTCGENLTWTLDSEGTLTIAGTGEMYDFEYVGINAGWLTTPWYDYHSEIKNVIIGEQVTSIGDYAFGEFNEVRTIAVPESVSDIGASAFAGCESLYRITIAGPITEISEYMFKDCTSLSTLIIPDGVTSIGECAFWNCTKLNEVTIPDGVAYIGGFAFAGCHSFSYIDIPAAVTNIAEGAFFECPRLTRITVSEDNAVYSSLEGVLYNKDKTDLICYPSGMGSSHFAIPDGVTTICDGAFHNNIVTQMGWESCGSSLYSITIPESVTYIGTEAFYSCERLQVVTFNADSKIASIGDYAFANCTALKEIYIPESVSDIGEYAFYHCESLTDITILNPDCVIRYGDDQFSDTIPGTVAVHGYNHSTAQAYAEQNGNNFVCLGEYGDLVIINAGTYGENLTWTLTSDGTLTIFGTGAMTDYTSESDIPWAFCRSVLRTVVIENGVTSIGQCAFYGCPSLKSVAIPEGVTRIEAGAFYECKNLDEILFPESLTYIGGQVFTFCESIKSITIPKNVETIEVYGITCAGVDFEEIIVDPENQYFSSVDGVLYNKDVSQLVVYPNGKKDAVFEMPDTVVSFAEYACESAYYLETLVLSDNVTEIGGMAFSYCYALKNIKFGKSLTTLWGWDFYGCTALESVIIPETVTVFKGTVFDHCTSLADVTFLNPDCAIGSDFFFDSIRPNYKYPATAIVHGYENSTAQADSEESGRTFHAITDVDNAVQPTCAAEGYTGDVYCAVCDKVIPSGEIIEKTEHSMSEWTVTKPAEGFQDGLEERSCQSCGHTESRVIPAPAAANTVTDPQSGVQLEYSAEAYPQEVTLQIEEVFDGSLYLTQQYGKIQTWNIKTCIDGEEVQPAVPVLVRLPLPDNYNSATVAVYHVNLQAGVLEQVQPVTVENGYICFMASSFSPYILVDESSLIETPDPEEPTEPDVPEEPDAPDEPDDPSQNCSHLCHSDGIMGFFWKILRFFWKLFGMNPVCECGAAHY